MDKLIFGSTALKHFYPDFREPKDVDYISREGVTTRQEQYLWADSFQYILDNNKDLKYVDPEFLLTVKMSHFAWPIFWDKTSSDILFLKRKGVEPDFNLYKSLQRDWVKLHGKKFVSLKGRDSENFFQDAIERKYNHDDLHKIVAIYNEPLYIRILKYPETNSVECSKEKFYSLSEEDQILLVKEELWATALERFLIPSNFTYGDNRAYFHSLKKLVTTMSSLGWFKDFVILNYSKLYKNNDWNFIRKFKNKYETNN